MSRIRKTLTSVFALSLASSLNADEETYRYVPHSTQKIAQITGDRDIGWRMATPTRTGERSGIYFTDLGIPFQHGERLAFLFGDTFSSLNEVHGPDFISYASSKNPRDFKLEFLTENGSNKPIRIDIPNTREEDFEVPTGAISIDGRIYMAFATESDGFATDAKVQMRKTLLCMSEDDGRTWESLYTLSAAEGEDFSQTHFINVSFVEAHPEINLSLLPKTARKRPVFLYGTGEYRKSQLYLAVTSASKLDRKTNLRYFTGLDASGKPRWSPNERDATPLIDQGYLGEISAAYLSPIGQYAISYVPENPGFQPRGVFLQLSRNPWGAFGDAQHIFEPWRDRGYTEFMHASDSLGQQDNVYDPGREFVWGGEYGAYLIAPFTRMDGNSVELYFTLSTWNPYQVVLMQTRLTTDPLDKTPSEYKRWTSLPGTAEWHRSSDRPFFNRWLDEEQTPYTQTEAIEGPERFTDTGVLWMDLPTDEAYERIEFEMWGGDTEAILLENAKDFPRAIDDVAAFYNELKSGSYGRIARVATGLRDSQFRRKALWALEPYERENLRLILIDPWQRNWGSGSISQIVMTNSNADTLSGLKDSSCDSLQKSIPYSSGAQRLSYASPDWRTYGEADEFIVEERYSRRYLASFTDSGTAASGAIALRIDSTDTEQWLSFYASGKAGEVILFDWSKLLEEALVNNTLSQFITQSPSSIRHRITVNDSSMPGRQIVWELPQSESGQLCLVIVDHHSTENPGFISVSEPITYAPGNGIAPSRAAPNKVTHSRRLAVGTNDWNFTGDEAISSYFDDDRSWASTFGPKGDDDVAYLWKGFPEPARPHVSKIQFKVAGTGGSVFLLEGEWPNIPNDRNPSELRQSIEAGEFGKVLQSATGIADITGKEVTWDLPTRLPTGARILILDDMKKEAWGFLSVSDFQLLAK